MREAACGSQTAIVWRDWCALADFSFFITDAYERGADGRSVDSRTIGDGERDTKEVNSWQLEEKGDQTRIAWCFLCCSIARVNQCVFEVGENPDHDKATTLSEKLVECGKRKEAERGGERKEERGKRKEEQYSVLVKETKK